MLSRLATVLAVILVMAFSSLSQAEKSFIPPATVSVRSVFFVPKGENLPDSIHIDTLIKHIKWCQQKYKELLDGRDSFRFSKESPIIYKAHHDLDYYRGMPEDGAPSYIKELLDNQKLNRLNCPYIFVVVVMNSKDTFPKGGGRPINGGINTGGGIVILSSFILLNSPTFQSTLRHELGHSFGLPHVDVYGYDMKYNHSIMSYNKAHQTLRFRESENPGKLIPEDIRALSLNRRVFPNLKFNPDIDLPDKYNISENIIWLGPMSIPGHFPYAIDVSTMNGEAYGSKATNAVLGQIKNNAGPGITYDAGTMWHSETSVDSWVSIDLKFPIDLSLNKIVVHSQHSGKYHTAKAVRVQVKQGAGFSDISKKELNSPDDAVGFSMTRGDEWRLWFKCGESHALVIRGLQFFHDDTEVFPPFVPYIR